MMNRIIRVGIVLGVALVTLGTSVAVAQTMPDAIDRALANEPAALADAHTRAQSVTVLPSDSHERAQPTEPTSGPVVSDPGWNVSWTNLVLAAAIAAGLTVAVILLVSTIRRFPPRGHPPLAHR